LVCAAFDFMLKTCMMGNPKSWYLFICIFFFFCIIVRIWKICKMKLITKKI
jgi:hypothetical protein